MSEAIVVTYPLFRHTGVVLARATTDPGDLDLLGEECIAGGDVDPRAGLEWLAGVWERDHIREAVQFASPALAGQVNVLLTAGHPGAGNRQIRRTVLAAATYLLRWHTRATPFGLFAGVTTASIRPFPAAEFVGHKVMARCDAQWLGTLTDRLECHAGLRSRLTVTLNSAGFTRGNRFVVPVHSTSSDPGIAPLKENSVRLSGPVRAVMTAAQAPMSIGHLSGSLNTQFPAAPAEKIGSLLAGLISQDVLLTCLRPTATAADPLTHVIGVLRDAGAADLPDVAALLAELETIWRQTAAHNTAATPREAASIRATLTQRMRALHDPPGPVLTADVALDADIAIPEPVLAEAEAAATVMLRLSAHPFGPTYWKDFQLRFRSRYGPGALVPVREVVADSGLGFPASYLGAPRGRSAYAVSGRDHLILNLIQQAAVDGHAEIELTEPLIQALTVGDPAEVVPPSRVEIGFELHADSREELAHGRFRVWITGAPRPENSMVGRFAHLLTESARQQLAATYASGDPEQAAMQLSFAPRGRVDTNIARTPVMLPRLISVAEPACDVPGGQIPIDDLAVTADATQLYLIQISTGQHIVPRVMNALEATLRTPPLARFLSEIASARHAVYGAFDFGVAYELSHLPRIRYRRAVLAPARWRLSAADLAPSTAAMRDWDKSFDAWCGRWRVPLAILFCQGELRLPLDLRDAFHRRLLRTRLERAGKAEIRESPGDATAGWAGRPCEFLVPLRAENQHKDQNKSHPSLALLTPASRPHMPGRAEVVHAQLVGNPARFTELITDHLPALIQTIGDVMWWYRRIRDTTRPDTDEYLHLYLRLARVTGYGAACGHLARWAGDLQSAGLLAHLNLLAYQAQPGRWGAGQAAHAAETVFAADTAAAVAELEMASLTGVPAQAIAAASMADLAANLTATPLAGLDAALRHLKRDTGKLDRALRDRTLSLAGPRADGESGSLRNHRGGDRVAAAWRLRAAAIAEWRAALGTGRDITAPLSSLLHDHHVRVIGVDPEGERITNRLVRAIALRRLALEAQAR